MTDNTINAEVTVRDAASAVGAKHFRPGGRDHQEVCLESTVVVN